MKLSMLNTMRILDRAVVKPVWECSHCIPHFRNDAMSQFTSQVVLIIWVAGDLGRVAAQAFAKQRAKFVLLDWNQMTFQEMWDALLKDTKVVT